MPRPRSATPSFSIAVRAGEDLYQRARLLAAVRCVPLAELVREALREFVDTADDMPTMPPARPSTGRRRGQVVQRGPSSWTIRISLPADVEGKRKTWNKTVHGTRQDAERALAHAIYRYDSGKLEVPA